MATHLPFPASFVAFAFATIPGDLLAQCPFDPTVAPANLILCPNTQDTLSTQVYESYQWYKGGVPIPGATDQTHVVDAYNDAGSMFSVSATLGGCTEMSPEVLVDGWAFLPPTVMTTGAEPLYYTQNGPVYCGTDTVLLVMMQPYDTNIQWTNGGNLIPGATNDTLVVTTPGQYSASGAPSTCPGFVQQLGVWIDVLFLPPTQPVIAQSGSQLCVSPEGAGYQWYLNGQPLAGSDQACIDGGQPGFYMVSVVYDIDCSLPAEGFLVTGIGTNVQGSAWNVRPQPARDRVTISSDQGALIGDWRLLDATGREVKNGRVESRSSLSIDVSDLGTGLYWLKPDERAAVRVTVVR